MLRSMFSGVSGLRSHQTMMDVVGNNIANVNTTGYKSSSVVFADTMSQLTATAGAPQNGQGGTDPAQVGLGVRVEGISQNFTQGSAEATGKAADLMLDGDGMFVVQNGDVTEYTRAGNFTLDNAGSLVTQDGGYVQGWRSDANGNISTSGPTGSLIINSDSVMPAAASTQSTIHGNLDKTTTPVQDPTAGTWSVPPQTTSFDVYNAQGAATRVTATYTNTATAAASAAAVSPTDTWHVNYTWTDSSGTAGTQAGGTVVFDATTGAFKTGAGGSNVTNPVTLNGTSVKPLMTTLTGYVSPSRTSSLTSVADGAAIGTLKTFAVGADGVITGSYSNGLKRNMGQVAVATFNNYGGLEKAGGSMYTVSSNSGVPNLGVPGVNGRGKIGSGELEMSNVDLSTEFTNLILAQRGFQANSKIITASDEILQDLVNLKR